MAMQGAARPAGWRDAPLLRVPSQLSVTTTQGAPAGRPALLGVTGLRGIAALVVVFHHVGLYTAAGAGAGVLGRVAGLLQGGIVYFFVLSGFLLYRPFASRLLDGGQLMSVWRYGAKRVARVLPTYFVVLVVTGFVVGAATVPVPANDPRPWKVGLISDPVAALLDFTLLQSYVPGYLLTGIGPAWSLSVEVAFYAALPFVAWVAARTVAAGLDRRAGVLVPPVLLVLAGWTGAWLVWRNERGVPLDQLTLHSWGQNWDSVLARSFLAHAHFFGYGMFAAVAMLALSRRGGLRTVRLVRGGAMALFVTLILVARLDVLAPVSVPMAGAAFAIGLLVLVFPLGRPGVEVHPHLLTRGLEVAPLRHLGALSYGLFLWHVPVVLWLVRSGLTFEDGVQGLLLNFALVVAVGLVLAWFTHVTVEKPLLRVRDRARASAGERVP